MYGCHRDLHVLTHSFPTRRSSDLPWIAETRFEHPRGAGEKAERRERRMVGGVPPQMPFVDAVVAAGHGPLRSRRQSILRQRLRPRLRARRSEEHTSELQSLMRISYAVFCLKKKNIHNTPNI